jgi:hypothetical protein
MSETRSPEVVDDSAVDQGPKDVHAKTVLSPILARLIEEVRNERADGPNAYNRMHNRHNRSR